MPRKATEINTQRLSLLKKQIVDKSGISLSRSVDCDHLAKEVSKITKSYINGITFKRLYGFTKYPFNPSIQTLDILCQYVGFKSWNEFEYYLLENKPISKKEMDIYLSIYDLDHMNDIYPHEGAFQSVSRKIYLRLREDPRTFLMNLHELTRKPYAQIFLVEHFPDYDNPCNYYYKVFEAYLTHKTADEAQLYGHCMLFYYSFWSIDKHECGKHLQQLNKIRVNKSIHPYVIGRYYACNLLYEAFFNEGKKINELYKNYLAIRKSLPKKGKHFYDFPASEYIVSEALIHCQEYQKCQQIVELGFSDYSFKMEFVRKGYYRQMQLLWLIASKKINLEVQIESELEKINPNNFYFISQKYFTVLYLFAKGSKQSIDLAKQLAKEMNNKYLYELFLNKNSLSKEF